MLHMFDKKRFSALTPINSVSEISLLSDMCVLVLPVYQHPLMSGWHFAATCKTRIFTANLQRHAEYWDINDS